MANQTRAANVNQETLNQADAEPEQASSDGVQIITVKGVKANASDNLTVAVWERHPDHPEDDNGNHEIFVSTNGESHKVAETPLVLEKLRQGVLKRV
jgi:hypothetical protein